VGGLSSQRTCSGLGTAAAGGPESLMKPDARNNPIRIISLYHWDCTHFPLGLYLFRRIVVAFVCTKRLSSPPRSCSICEVHLIQ
jgi:hypothetical protein